MKKIFSNKKALVIGGTGGIGKSVALGLADRGADLVIHGGSSAERLYNTLKMIRETGAGGEGFLLPINGPETALKIIEYVPDPDILVCAWGPFKRAPLESLDLDFWRTMIGGNLIFPGALASSFLPHMLNKNWGRILFFGGTNTDIIRGYSTSAAYSAAKTALGVIAKSIAKSIASREKLCDITCNVICPGLTDTEYLNDEIREYNRVKSPGNRSLEPSDIAKVCMDILENPWINGAIIPVDKGICV